MNARIHPGRIPHIRTWQGERLSPVEEMFGFHKDTGPVPETLRRLHAAFEKENTEYVVIGAAGMAALGFRRATEDVDPCIRAAGLDRFRNGLVGTVYRSVGGRSRRFHDPQTQVTFDLSIAGELAGHRGRNKSIRFPDPAETVENEGLRTVPLERFVALKPVTWRLQDWADVIRLIRANRLDEEYSRRLPKEVRSAYLQCYDHKLEEDRQDAEYGEH